MVNETDGVNGERTQVGLQTTGAMVGSSAQMVGSGLKDELKHSSVINQICQTSVFNFDIIDQNVFKVGKEKTPMRKKLKLQRR